MGNIHSHICALFLSHAFSRKPDNAVSVFTWYLMPGSFRIFPYRMVSKFQRTSLWSKFFVLPIIPPHKFFVSWGWNKLHP